jgi:hypothetical protein
LVYLPVDNLTYQPAAEHPLVELGRTKTENTATQRTVSVKIYVLSIRSRPLPTSTGPGLEQPPHSNGLVENKRCQLKLPRTSFLGDSTLSIRHTIKLFGHLGAATLCEALTILGKLTQPALIPSKESNNPSFSIWHIAYLIC